MLIKIISFILGILSLLYFAAYAVSTGLTNTFTYFWLLLGIVLLVIALFYKTLKRLFKMLPMDSDTGCAGCCCLCIGSVDSGGVMYRVWRQYACSGSGLRYRSGSAGAGQEAHL